MLKIISFNLMGLASSLLTRIDPAIHLMIKDYSLLYLSICVVGMVIAYLYMHLVYKKRPCFIYLILCFTFITLLNTKYLNILHISSLHAMLLISYSFVLLNLVWIKGKSLQNLIQASFSLFVCEFLVFGGPTKVCQILHLDSVDWDPNIILGVLSLTYVLVYLVLLNKLYAYFKTELKTHSLHFLFFSKRVEKLIIFERLLKEGRKEDKKAFIVFIENLILYPMRLISYGRTYALPFFGGLISFSVIFKQDTTLSLVMFFFVSLVSLCVNSEVLQNHFKKNYGPLFFKAGLWNTTGLLCKTCISVAITAGGIEVANQYVSGLIADNNFKRDTQAFELGVKRYYEDRANYGPGFSGTLEQRPVRSNPRYTEYNALVSGVRNLKGIIGISNPENGTSSGFKKK